jgi:probable HAF family extracellular repeat protein
MKSKTLTLIAIAALGALVLPWNLPAQQHHHYKLIDLGTFGGPNSSLATQPVFPILNNQGMVTGIADSAVPAPGCNTPFATVNPSDCFQTDGFKWEHGALVKLEPLRGGSNSGGFYINDLGWIMGESDNGQIDPQTQIPVQLAVLYPVWGGVINLGTFGGAFSFGNAINDFGQAVGGALNETPDPYTSDPYVFGLPGSTQLHAFLWENGKMHDLKTLGGPDSWALYINDSGQIAGNSLTDSVVNPTTQSPTMAPFLWENGKMQNIGSLGGLAGGVVGLNNNGQVAGNSDLPGDQDLLGFLWDHGIMTPIPALGGTSSIALSLGANGEVVGFGFYPGDQNGDAFVWKSGAITDLGRFGNDPCSVASSINIHGQIVGVSTDCADGERAVLWENGEPIVDLNTLIPPNSDLYLHEADYINDNGEITGTGFLSNGDQHVFLLVPLDDDQAGNLEAAVPAVIPPTPPRSNASPSDLSKLSPTERAAALRARVTRMARRYRNLSALSN